MPRKEVINKFDKGLMMDANPLSTSPEVLTSALNVTLITFNGSEFMLQSDMGNGRVETAYLPSGYVPVGMVEFGGIIYVVSYNPFDNRGQIGSFPSPERNISSEETDNAVITLTEGDFQFDATNGAKVLYVQKNLYKEMLSPGDKYLVYAREGQISGNYGKLTDYGNGEANTVNVSGQVNTKATNLYFATITDEGKIVKLGNLRLHDVGGKKYIIPEMNIGPDQKPVLDSYRNVVSSPYNIFNSKVSGKLLLIAELLTVDSFSVSVLCQFSKERETVKDGKRISVKDITILMDMTYESQSNVFLYGVKSEYNDTGGSAGTGSVLWTGKHTESNGAIDASNRYNQAQLMETIKDYDITNRPERDVTYTLTPCMTYGPIDYLSVSGIIQLDKVGTGYMELYEWRYYIDNSSIMLNWAMECYPEEGYQVNGVRFIMTCVNRKNEYETIIYNVTPKKSYNGSFTETIPFDSEYYKIEDKGMLLPDRLYFVTVEVMYEPADGLAADGETLTSRYKYFYRWLYTCDIFNDIYRQGEIYDFIELSPEIGLGTNAEEAGLKLKAVQDEQVFTYKGTIMSEEEITDKDTLSCEQYYNKLFVSSDNTVHSVVNETYNLFELDPGSVKINVKVENDKDLKSPVTRCDIVSTDGTIPISAEEMLTIYERATHDLEENDPRKHYDPFRPPMSEDDEGAADPFEPDLTEEKYNNDIRLENYSDVDFTSLVGVVSFTSKENSGSAVAVIVETVEHVKAIGAIKQRSITAKSSVRPICYNIEDFERYNLRWDEDTETDSEDGTGKIGHFIGNWMGGYCRNDPSGTNNRMHIQFSTINNDGSWGDRTSIKLDGDASWSKNSEYADGANSIWNQCGSTLLVASYAAFERGKNNDMWSYWCERGSLKMNDLWASNGWNTDSERFSTMERGLDENKAVHTGSLYFVAMKTKNKDTWVPINMGIIPGQNNVSDNYSHPLKQYSPTFMDYTQLFNEYVYNIYNAVATMLIQLYWMNNTSETIQVYAPYTSIYDNKVMTDFSINIHINNVYEEGEDGPKIMVEVDEFNGPRIYIDEELGPVLWGKNHEEVKCQENDKNPFENWTEEEIELLNKNITFVYKDEDNVITVRKQSERSALNLQQRIQDMTSSSFNTLIRQNTGRFDFSDNNFSQNTIYDVYEDDDDNLAVRALSNDTRIEEGIKFKKISNKSGSSSIVVEDSMSIINSFVQFETSSRFKNKLCVDNAGLLYLDDSATGETIDKMELNAVAERMDAGRSTKEPKLRGFSKFTPFYSLQMYRI